MYIPKGKTHRKAEENTMKRAERSEYTIIKNSLKKNNWGAGTILTIRTNAGSEYKEALHRLYGEYGFHPTGVTVDRRRFDDLERILYIHGKTWKDDKDRIHSWTELYTAEEKALFNSKLA